MGNCLRPHHPQHGAVVSPRLRDNQEPEVKTMVVLGSHGTGKSTLNCQYLYAVENEPINVDNIKKHIILSFNTLIMVAKESGLILQPENENTEPLSVEHATTLLESRDFVQKLKNLWSDPAIQTILSNQHKHAVDFAFNLQFLVEKLDSMASGHYKPTLRDLLYTRLRTVGIYDREFVYDNQRYKIHDVGGTPTERKKWVTLLNERYEYILCISLLSFYTPGDESGPTKLVEDLALFDELMQTKYMLMPYQVIFVLSHGDILQQNLQTMSVKQVQSYPLMDKLVSDRISVKIIGEYIMDLFLEKRKEVTGYIYNDIYKDPKFIYNQIMLNEVHYRGYNDPTEVYWDVPMKIETTSGPSAKVLTPTTLEAVTIESVSNLQSVTESVSVETPADIVVEVPVEIAEEQTTIQVTMIPNDELESIQVIIEATLSSNETDTTEEALTVELFVQRKENVLITQESFLEFEEY